MDGIVNWLKAAAGVVGGIIAYVFGPWDALTAALVCAAALDYASGLVKAGINKKLDSSTGFKGLLKKGLMFAVVGLAAVVDRAVPAANQAIRAAVEVFYIANEGLSILENAGEMGLPLPDALKSILAKLKDGKGGSGGGEKKE